MKEWHSRVYINLIEAIALKNTELKNTELSTSELKDLVVNALEDTKAKDISVIDVREITDVTDLMIIASGTSSRHVKSLAINLGKACKEAGVMPMGMEGEEQAEWVLVDLGDIVVHLMMPSARQFYDLESLWETNAEPLAEAE